MSTEKSQFLHELEVEVKTELDVVGSSSSLEEAGEASPAEWLFDPIDVEREQVGLGNLLGAIRALEDDPTG
jgi:hypothetical protein